MSSSIDLSEVICIWNILDKHDEIVGIGYGDFEKAIREIVHINDDLEVEHVQETKNLRV